MTQAPDILAGLRRLIGDDAAAITYQTMGQYRGALIGEFNKVNEALAAAPHTAAPATDRAVSERETMDSLRVALEVIALGDSRDPVRDAADTLVELGLWRAEAVAELRKLAAPPADRAELADHAANLRKAAAEIRAEGHKGWGNACAGAADAIDALARSTDAPSEPKGEHYDEVKATLTALHAFVESLCSPAIYRRLGPAASHARGFTHKITHALRHLAALATPPAAATSTPKATQQETRA